jgi:hypothetical protein
MIDNPLRDCPVDPRLLGSLKERGIPFKLKSEESCEKAQLIVWAFSQPDYDQLVNVAFSRLWMFVTLSYSTTDTTQTA